MSATPINANKIHPSLEVSGGGLDSFLPAFTTLNRPYKSYPVVGSNTHVETIFAYFFRATPDVRFRRECLRTKDNGTVSLDWVAGDDVDLSPSSPTLILLPGLTGGSGDSYVRHMLVRARKKGWRVVVFNSRGCGHGPVTTPQFYSASFMGDISEVVEHVSSRYPDANLYAAGWSLGANILIRYLAQESASCRLSGAVSLCNPFNLPVADEDFRKGFNKVYDKALSSSLRRIFRKHAQLFEEMSDEYNIPAAANCKSVREFDEALTRVSFGFKSVDDYYSKSSSSDSIQHVCKPLLCIQAENDPIAPARGIPREAINVNSNCMLIVTPEGGHLGWVAGDEAPFGCPWTDPVVMDFLEYLEKTYSNSVLNPEDNISTLQPGLSGGSDDSYVRHMLVRARNKGWRVVVFNSRGCADSPVTTPQMYSGSFLGDLDEVVKHIVTRYPKASLYGAGWSMGANILVQYLGKEAGARNFSGAVSLCNPFNLVMSDEDLCKGFNRIYNRSLAKALSGILKKHLMLFEDIGGEYNIQLAANAETIRDYDEGLTRVSFGFKSVDEYLQKSCSADYIKYVRAPLLCIQAKNDPIAPDRAIPREDIKDNPNCVLIVTPKGGHLGWVAGEDAPTGCPWTDPMVMDFLQHLENEKSGARQGAGNVLQSVEA